MQESIKNLKFGMLRQKFYLKILRKMLYVLILQTVLIMNIKIKILAMFKIFQIFLVRNNLPKVKNQKMINQVNVNLIVKATNPP